MLERKTSVPKCYIHAGKAMISWRAEMNRRRNGLAVDMIQMFGSWSWTASVQVYFALADSPSVDILFWFDAAQAVGHWENFDDLSYVNIANCWRLRSALLVCCDKLGDCYLSGIVAPCGDLGLPVEVNFTCYTFIYYMDIPEVSNLGRLLQGSCSLQAVYSPGGFSWNF